MKNLILASLLFLGALTCYGQAKPKRGDNLVLVQTPDSAATAIRKLGAIFVSQGYTIEKLDNSFYTLLIAPKVLLTSFQPTFKARASAAPGGNSVLRLTGESTAAVMGRYFNYIAQVEGSERGVPISGFRVLEKAALAYPGGQVSYGKQ